jgi:YfiH family protein
VPSPNKLTLKEISSGMAFKEKEGLRFFQFELFKNQPIFHAVLTRKGGFSQAPYNSLNTGGTVGDDPDAVLKNHQKIYRVFGFDYHSRFDVWQVHSTEILCGETPREPGTLHTKADGILTDNADITLFMRFADCVPILLMDPVKKVIGIIHAGWQGTSQKIALAAVKKMQECYHTHPEDILAGIGPSICQQCYEVGSEVYDAFIENFGEKANGFFTYKGNHSYLNLWKANQETLKDAGVTQIETSGICTACHLDDWFSHRAEGGRTGRFGVLMKILHH